MKLEKLVCAIQNYAWGRPGNNSEVARLKNASNKDFIIDENKPYAEV